MSDFPVAPPVPNPFAHYFKDVRHLDSVDVYRVLLLFNVTDPCLQHAIKKLLVAGGRGVKDAAKDVREAVVALERWEKMRDEDLSFRLVPIPPKR